MCPMYSSEALISRLEFAFESTEFFLSSMLLKTSVITLPNKNGDVESLNGSGTLSRRVLQRCELNRVHTPTFHEQTSEDIRPLELDLSVSGAATCISMLNTVF